MNVGTKREKRNNMKVKDLLESIDSGKRQYKDFLDWNVALEHVPNPKKDCNCKNDIIKHYDDITQSNWYFIKSHSMGCNTYFIKQKIFGIQIHY